MTNFEFLRFILSNAAMAYIISQSKIFHPLRMWAKGVSNWIYDFLICCLCNGFWTSVLALASVNFTLLKSMYFSDYFLLTLFSYCCIGSLTAYLTFKIIKRL